MPKHDQMPELARCYRDAAHFIDSYCQIYDVTAEGWIPFKLWPAQRDVIDCLINNRLVVILKARQLGLTWLLLGYALWMMIFHPIATVLLFSRRDTESMYLLGDDRLRGMYSRLPEWLRAGDVETSDSAHEWQLNGKSVARAFPTSAGDSYTASLAIVDEADLVPDLNRLMNAVKPTIDGGGQMVLLSRADKSHPQSEFKAIYRAAKTGSNGWAAVFLPWHVRPERTPQWYDLQRRDIQSRTGALDDLHQQYPETDVEALAPNTLDKRIESQRLGIDSRQIFVNSMENFCNNFLRQLLNQTYSKLFQCSTNTLSRSLLECTLQPSPS